MKADLKIWNRDDFGNLNLIKSSIVQEIKNFDRQDCNGQVGESQRQARTDLIRRLWEIDNKIESLTRQKARTNCDVIPIAT